MPGIYIYAQELPDGGWSPIFISQSRDLPQRLEGHVSKADSVISGATHVHVHYSTAGQGARFSEERDLVQRWSPACNDPLET